MCIYVYICMYVYIYVCNCVYILQGDGHDASTEACFSSSKPAEGTVDKRLTLVLLGRCGVGLVVIGACFSICDQVHMCTSILYDMI